MKKKNNNDKQQYEEESSSDLENDFDDNEEYEPSNRQDDKLSVNAESDTSTCENKSKKPVKNTKKKLSLNSKKQVVIFNVADTKYDVVKHVGRKIFKWKLSYDNEAEWDILWTDNAVQPEQLAKMQHFQKINHFPGMYSLARKNHLGRNLMRMRKQFPDHFKFFPPTWLLPAEFGDFRTQFTKKNGNKTFILKPEASCQGRGIFLTRNIDNLDPSQHYVAQRYIHRPYLIDGLKFDCRIYVLLAGCDPLRIYLYEEGLGRFATEEYVVPTKENLDNVCMHLTNYAINKDNPNFVFNETDNKDNVGHKWSFTAVLDRLKKDGADTTLLMDEVKKIIIKTFCSVQPILGHNYHSCQPESFPNNMCFEVLGFDILIDHKLKPWLLEVNHTPSFTTDTPLDRTIKKNVIKDALKLMNISVKNKIKFKNNKKAEFQQRVITGKKVRLSQEEKAKFSEQGQLERDEYENKNMGKYEKLYPIGSEEDKKYEEFIKHAQKLWEEWTGANIRRNSKKQQDEKSREKNPPFQTSPNPNSNSNKGNKTQELERLYNQKKGQTMIKKPSPLPLRKVEALKTDPESESNYNNNLNTNTNEASEQADSNKLIESENTIQNLISNQNNSNNNNATNGKNIDFRIKTKVVSTPSKHANSAQDLPLYANVMEDERLKRKGEDEIGCWEGEGNGSDIEINNEQSNLQNFNKIDQNVKIVSAINLEGKTAGKFGGIRKNTGGNSTKPLANYLKEKNAEILANQGRQVTKKNIPSILNQFYNGNFIVPKVMEFSLNGVLRPEEEQKIQFMEGHILKNKGLGLLKNPLVVNENYLANNPNVFNVQKHINFFSKK